MSESTLHEALNNIAIVPSQLYGAPPLDLLRETITAPLTLGERTVERPIELETPICLAGQPGCYAEKDWRLALIHAAGMAGTLADCGSYGLLDEEKKLAIEVGARTGLRLNTSRVGSAVPLISDTNAVILSLVHPGSGTVDGQNSALVFPGKLASEIREQLGLIRDDDIINPPRMLDMDTPRDLNKIVQLMHEITNYQVPVLIKIGAGQAYNDIRIAVNAEPEGIILDRNSNSPGVKTTVMDNIGIPQIGVLNQITTALKDGKAEKNDVKLIYYGDLRSGSDIFKVLAFGAAGVMISSAPLEAAGYFEPGTSSGKSKKIDPAHAGLKISQVLNVMLDELKALSAWTGHDSVSGITTDNLRAVTYDTAAVTGLKLMGYDKVLTMWEH